MQDGRAAVENRYPFPKTLKIELPYDLAISMTSTGFLFLWMVGLVSRWMDDDPPIHPPSVHRLFTTIHPSSHPATHHASTHPSIHLPIHPLSVCPSIHPPVRPSVHPPVRPSVRPSIHPLLTHPSITHLSIHLRTHPSTPPSPSGPRFHARA